MDGSRLTDRVATQVGRSFPGPGPRMNPRVHAERAVHERADGPFSFSGQIAAWRAERTLRERADGPFSFPGQIRVMNSNIS
jgi:hypothetical protein